MTGSKAVLRIIDANLNRLGEGLRFLEEIARFVLDDERLTTEFKKLRHDLAPQDLLVKTDYLDARKSDADVGASIKIDRAEPARDLSQAAIANARRAEEALRVLEELAKTAHSGLDSAKLQDARFTIYNLEKELLSKILRRDRAARLCGLHAVVNTDSLGKRSHAEVAGEMLAGGARVIQLRDKSTPRNTLLSIALELKELCARHEAIFIINDALDIALACGADGLHVGQDDLPVKVVRQLLPVDKLVGCSVRDMAEAKQAISDGADYLGYGPVYATTSKIGCQVIGCKHLSELKRGHDLPLIAIGGINQDNVANVMHCGADGIAVISALLASDSVEQATRDLIKAMEASREPVK